MEINRRQFLSACGSAFLINGLQLGFSRQAMAASSSKPHTLIYVFLRGGIDGLNLIVPTDGEARANYEKYRDYGKSGSIALPRAGATNGPLALADNWGINPNAAELRDIWQDKNLAVIHTTGMLAGENTRSHFDAQKFIEHGTVANTNTQPLTGWLARYLNGLNGLDNFSVPAFSANSTTANSLSGFSRPIALDSFDGFSPVYYARTIYPHDETFFEKSYLQTLTDVYKGSSEMDNAMQVAQELINTVREQDFDNITPPSGANYPKDGNGRLKAISKDFHRVAQMIRAGGDLGLQTATVDVGGWDTHENQHSAYYSYDDRLAELSAAIGAFYNEMAATGHGKDYTMVIQSEFGRRVRQNGNKGTDHGTGNVMMVIGDKVNGGRFYGQAPTLAESTLFGREDVPAYTDYRKVLREVLGVGLNVSNNDLATIFPGYSDTSMLRFMKSPILFTDGFE